MQMLLGNIGKFSPTPTGSTAGTTNGFSVGH